MKKLSSGKEIGGCDFYTNQLRIGQVQQITFGQRPEESEKGSHVQIWTESFPVGG